MAREAKTRDAADRLPPGQYLARDFPVLHVGTPPRFDPKTWRFRVFGLVEEPQQFDWERFTSLPTKTVTTDIHCVTRWTRLDTTWEGVSFSDIARLARPKPAAASKGAL